MLIGIMKNPVLYTIYEYDTDLFITMFCENKDRPQMKCDGKCYLSKMQKEQNEKDASNMLKQLQTEIVYYNPVTPVYIAGNEVRFIEETEKTSYYNRLYSFLFTSYLVKPPEVATLS